MRPQIGGSHSDIPFVINLRRCLAARARQVIEHIKL